MAVQAGNGSNHECDHCGHPVDVVDRFRDYSTTRGPMAEHVVTRCATCGQQDLVHLAAQPYSPPMSLS